MAEIKADTTTAHHQKQLPVTVSEPDISEQKPQKPKRVASLDVFRGLTVAVHIYIFFIHIYTITYYTSFIFIFLCWNLILCLINFRCMYFFCLFVCLNI